MSAKSIEVTARRDTFREAVSQEVLFFWRRWLIPVLWPSAVPFCISGGCCRQGSDGKACDWFEHRRKGYPEGHHGAGVTTAVSAPSAVVPKADEPAILLIRFRL